MKQGKWKPRLSALTIIAISVTVAAAVAVSVLAFVTVYSRALSRDAATNSEQSVQQTGVAVGNYLSDVKEKLNQLCAEISDSADVAEVNRRISIAARLESDIAAIMVYNQSGELLACGSDGGILKSDLSRNLSYDKELFRGDKDYAVSLPHVQTLFKERYPWVVTIVHREYQELFGGEVSVAIDFSFTNIAKYVDQVGIGQHGYCYIIDKSGSIVYHPQQQLLFSGLKQEDIGNVSVLEDGVHPGKNVITALQTLTDSDWRIVGVSYTEELTLSKRQTVFTVVLLSFIFCAAVALLILLLFSKIVTRPVHQLVKAMQEFEQSADTYRYRCTEERVSELQTLSDSFEHMVSMVQELMERVRHEEISLRKTELKALQAQINPHFLYNTLDSIQWMCEQGKNADAVKMVGALAKLFRISISRGHELITLRDEVRHAESYLVIQSYRYKNQFTYQFNVDKSIEDCLCNKITIQPLLENAIYHGIEPMLDDGIITVNVRQDTDGDILIEVADNGVGMTPEQCSSILQKERSDSGGIGIKNVNDRLRIYFGEKYGISIESELDCGTKITVRIPTLRKEPETDA